MQQLKSKVISILFGVDIGGSGVKGAPVDIKTGELLADRYKIRTPEVATPSEMVEKVKMLLNHFNWEGPVGIGFPSLIRENVVIRNSNLHPDWVGMNIKKFFKQGLNQKVQVMNDADAAGLAEAHWGAGKGAKGLVILCTFGTGIGSAILYNGKLIPNTELGHLDYNGAKYELFSADSIRKKEELSYEDWGLRVNQYLQHLEMLFSPQLFIIGGGASKKLELFAHQLDLQTPFVAAKMLNVAGTVGAAMGYQLKKKGKF